MAILLPGNQYISICSFSGFFQGLPCHRPGLSPREANGLDRPGRFGGRVFLATAIRIADQWKKAAALHMGKYRDLKSPGFSVIILNGQSRAVKNHNCKRRDT
jgi:hypothetical protein